MSSFRANAALSFVFVACIALPSSAVAEWVTISPFSGPEIDLQWSVNGPADAVQNTPEGVRITATKPVTIFRPLDLSHPVDVIVINATTASRTEGLLLWHARDTPDERIVQLPIIVEPNGGLPTRLAISVHNFPGWDRYADAIGLDFPAGTDIVINDVRFHGLSFAERCWNAVLSLGVFDTFARHSINFLWGPLLGFDADTRATLFDRSPPLAWSVNRVLLPAIGIALVVLAAMGLWAFPSRRLRLLRIALGIVVFAWLLFDLRMGLEILQYARRDLMTYALKPQGERRLRGMSDFHETMAAFLTITEGKDRIGFVSNSDLLLDSSAVYEAYPRSVALPGESQEGVDTWFIFYRTDAVIDPAGRLVVGGVPLSGPGGRILKTFNSHAAIFTTVAP